MNSRARQASLEKSRRDLRILTDRIRHSRVRCHGSTARMNTDDWRELSELAERFSMGLGVVYAGSDGPVPVLGKEN